MDLTLLTCFCVVSQSNSFISCGTSVDYVDIYTTFNDIVVARIIANAGIN